MATKITICLRSWTNTQLKQLAHPEYSLARKSDKYRDMVFDRGWLPNKFVELDVDPDEMYGIFPEDGDAYLEWFNVTVDDEWFDYLCNRATEVAYERSGDTFDYEVERFEEVWDVKSRKYRSIKNKRYAAQREFMMRMASEMEYNFTAGEDSGISWKDLAEVLVSYAQEIRKIMK